MSLASRSINRKAINSANALFGPRVREYLPTGGIISDGYARAFVPHDIAVVESNGGGVFGGAALAAKVNDVGTYVSDGGGVFAGSSVVNFSKIGVVSPLPLVSGGAAWTHKSTFIFISDGLKDHSELWWTPELLAQIGFTIAHHISGEAVCFKPMIKGEYESLYSGVFRSYTKVRVGRWFEYDPIWIEGVHISGTAEVLKGRVVTPTGGILVSGGAQVAFKPHKQMIHDPSSGLRARGAGMVEFVRHQFDYISVCRGGFSGGAVAEGHGGLNLSGVHGGPGYGGGGVLRDGGP